ncbi:M3 family metallopeptidase [Thalassotalea atypica]|uniref:M3 family metallopeptidase n=1 Tax=Thalassotalea atypica TaxID=2054316 RepID=UPI0025745281|nr:M3 family metallopeptidase [Thalassotalea atypica]
MQKVSSTISAICRLFFIIGLLGHNLAYAGGVQSAQRDLYGHDIGKRCGIIFGQLKSAANQPSKLVTSNKSATFFDTIHSLEQTLIPAQNLLFESYLMADVSPDKDIQKQARACQLKLSAAMDLLIGSEAMSSLLKLAKQRVTNSSEQRVLDRYQQQHLSLANEDYAVNKQQLKEVAAAFRQGTTAKVNKPFELSYACLQKLPKKLKTEFDETGHSSLAINKRLYLSLLNKHPVSNCRQEVYRQYQRRHEQGNQAHLAALITKKNRGAKYLGYQNFAEYSLRNTQLESVDNVNALLTEIASKLPSSSAPWDYRFDAKQEKMANGRNNKKSAAQTITPEIAHQGLFKLLKSEFALTITQLAVPTWHSSVQAYELTQNDKLIGEFYLDLYSREGKYKKNRHRAIQRGVTNVQLPRSALILSLPKKNWRQKHLKSFFHEFGHLLHNMLSTQPYHVNAGISIESDLIEMPAKWFEWLSFDPAVQQQMFGQVIVDSQGAAQETPFKLRLYRAAMALAYFSESPEGNSLQLEQINQRLFRQYTGFDYPKSASSQYSFSHLATYGPRYFSYIFSELVARKLLRDYKARKFKGADFLTKIIAKGGSKTMAEMLSDLYHSPLTINQFINWVSHDEL